MVKTSGRRVVELGRYVTFLNGPNTNKTGVVLEIVDSNRVLVEGAKGQAPRHIARITDTVVTPVKVDGVRRNEKQKKLFAAIAAQGTEAEYAETNISKRISATAARAGATDFDRFLIRKARAARSQLAKKILKEKGYDVAETEAHVFRQKKVVKIGQSGKAWNQRKSK